MRTTSHARIYGLLGVLEPWDLTALKHACGIGCHYAVDYRCNSYHPAVIKCRFTAV